MFFDRYQFVPSSLIEIVGKFLSSEDGTLSMAKSFWKTETKRTTVYYLALYEESQARIARGSFLNLQ